MINDDVVAAAAADSFPETYNSVTTNPNRAVISPYNICLPFLLLSPPVYLTCELPFLHSCQKDRFTSDYMSSFHQDDCSF